MNSPAPHRRRRKTGRLASAARRWLRLANGVMKHALIASVFIALSLATFALWWYLRLFACWADLEDKSRYLCDYDFLILVAATLYACIAIYFALKPIRTDAQPRRHPSFAIIAAVILLMIFCVIASPIRFPLFS
jgi:hypothetical protein